MTTLTEIADFVRQETGYRSELSVDASLQDDVRIYGDDVQEFMEEYAKRFGVDLSSYLWYFHTGDEGGLNLGGLFFPPPQARVSEIPITMEMLRSSAEAGRWIVRYPEHSVPKRRYDLVVNQAMVSVVALLLIYAVARRILG